MKYPTTEEKEIIENRLRELFTNQPLTSYPSKNFVFSCLIKKKKSRDVEQWVTTLKTRNVPTESEVIAIEIYRSLKDFIRRHLSIIHQDLNNFSDVDLVDFYIKICNNFLISTSVANGCFNYLNKIYVKNIIEKGDIKINGDAVINSLRGRIQKNIGLYIELSEEKFLKETETFYKKFSIEYLHKYSFSKYLAMCEEKIKKEQEYCIRYMDPHTLHSLTVTLSKVFIGEHNYILKKVLIE
uniref:Cullin domain-containing protein n=1 Tax=Strongyloides venezuelensis TaxID=75913 RepID=A0A0K0F5V4_STRVS